MKTLRPAGVSTQFLVFPISTRVDITVYQHGNVLYFLNINILLICNFLNDQQNQTLVQCSMQYSSLDKKPVQVTKWSCMSESINGVFKNNP